MPRSHQPGSSRTARKHLRRFPRLARFLHSLIRLRGSLYAIAGGVAVGTVLRETSRELETLDFLALRRQLDAFIDLGVALTPRDAMQREESASRGCARASHRSRARRALGAKMRSIPNPIAPMANASDFFFNSRGAILRPL